MLRALLRSAPFDASWATDRGLIYHKLSLFLYAQILLFPLVKFWRDSNGVVNVIHILQIELKQKQNMERGSTKNNLKRHQNIQTGKKLNKCSICGAEFSHPSILKRHTKTHTGDKHIKCKQCGHAFIDAGDLKRHLRTHTGEKSN